MTWLIVSWLFCRRLIVTQIRRRMSEGEGGGAGVPFKTLLIIISFCLIKRCLSQNFVKHTCFVRYFKRRLLWTNCYDWFWLVSRPGNWIGLATKQSMNIINFLELWSAKCQHIEIIEIGKVWHIILGNHEL